MELKSNNFVEILEIAKLINFVAKQWRTHYLIQFHLIPSDGLFSKFS